MTSPRVNLDVEIEGQIKLKNLRPQDDDACQVLKMVKCWSLSDDVVGG